MEPELHQLKSHNVAFPSGINTKGKYMKARVYVCK
jgi:hypothetical protein